MQGSISFDHHVGQVEIDFISMGGVVQFLFRQAEFLQGVVEVRIERFAKLSLRDGSALVEVPRLSKCA